MGIGSALLVPASPTLAAASVSVAIGLILASRRVRSIGKFAGRFLPSSLLVLAFVDGLRASSLPGYAVALGTCVSTVLLVRAYRARGPHRGPCHACPERTRAIPCRGYAPIVRRERAFRRRAGILLGSS